MPSPTHPAPRFRGRDYAAFLFDMDGTMLDSSAVVVRTWTAWAERHGIEARALLETIHGVRAIDTVRRYAPAGIDAEAEAALLLEQEMADVDGIVPIAGIEAVVAALDQGAWAVVTSAPRALATRRLRAAGLPEPRVLIAAEDVARGKPDPEGFVKAAEQLGVSIGECLVFEDSPAGVAAAEAAGAQVAIVGGLVAPTGTMISLTDYR